VTVHGRRATVHRGCAGREVGPYYGTFGTFDGYEVVGAAGGSGGGGGDVGSDGGSRCGY
jgi:hypothetical protein